jgi:hypothetical protein
MYKYRINEFVNGWFIGNFEPSILKTSSFEIAFKEFKKGSNEQNHFQLTAVEITLVIEGQILLGGELLVKGEIAIIEPLEQADFFAITDAAVVCIKFPSIPNDKRAVQGE